MCYIQTDIATTRPSQRKAILLMTERTRPFVKYGRHSSDSMDSITKQFLEAAVAQKKNHGFGQKPIKAVYSMLG